jgi:hypothetical protein
MPDLCHNVFMKKRINKTKLNYWIVTDEGVIAINKKAYDDGCDMDMAVFKSREDAMDYLLESFSMKLFEMSRSLDSITFLLREKK